MLLQYNNFIYKILYNDIPIYIYINSDIFRNFSWRDPANFPIIFKWGAPLSNPPALH